MRIEKVKIQNFRKYTGIHEFSLDKKINIFYGPNGYGKSTFFDAIEWCLTGNIQRFNKYKDFNDKEVMSLQCDATNSVCSVEIEFNNHHLLRSFTTQNGKIGNLSASITLPDGKKIVGKNNVDQFLRKGLYKSDQQENIRSLVKQSHILSQDQITEFIINDDPKKRFQSLADIIGLNSTVNLLDNLKGIRDTLGLNLVKITEKIQGSNLVIDRRKADLLAYDNTFFFNWSNGLQLPINIIELIGRIPDIQQDLLADSGTKSRILEQLNKIKAMGYSTVKEGVNDKYKIENEVDINSKKINELIALVSKITQLIKTLNGDKSSLVKLNRLKNEEENYARSIREFQSKKEIKSLEMADIWELLRKKEQESPKYEIASEYKSEYEELKKSLTELPTSIQESSQKISHFETRIRRLRLLIEDKKERLAKHTDHTLLKLVSNINDIFLYLEQNEDEEICPVCLTNHGKDLSNKVRRSIDIQKSKIQETNKISAELLNTREKYKSLLQTAEERLNFYKDDKNEKELKLKKNSERISIIQQFENFSLEIFEQNIEFIQNTKNLILNDIKELEDLKNTFEKLNKIRKDLSSIQQETGISKITDLKNVDARLVRLKKADNRVRKYKDRVEERIQMSKKKINELSSALIDISKNSLATEQQINLHDLINVYEVILQKSKKEYEATVSFTQNYSVNNKITDDIQNLNFRNSKMEKTLLNIQNSFDELSEFLDGLASNLGSTAKDMLNKSSFSIQKYFRYLNPMPFKAPIHFDGEQDELKILVQLDEEQTKLSNAQYTLSSGQLNVLAIAIFLAINQSQKISILDFVAIDDPIQNMDDVNRFSICDVLGTLKNQVLFSTHDYDFVKLFVKKNEHRKEEIQIFMIDSPSLKNKNIKNIRFN